MRKYLFLFVALLSQQMALAQLSKLTFETLAVDYDSAWQYKNLRLVPIRPKGGGGDRMPGVISLAQAIQMGIATVSERGTASTENVHFLRINNHSDQSLLISSGELISGGRQDRMVAHDTLLAPNGKDQYISVMCVEENRWSDKEKKFTYGNFANPNLRRVLDEEKNQVLIWKEVGSQLDQGQIRNKTLSYLSRNTDKKFVASSDEYFKFFQEKFRKSDSNMVGVMAISGDRVIAVDVYAAKNLFYGQLDPLLKGYIDGAVFYGSSPVMEDDKIREYADKLFKDEKSQEEFVKYNGKIFRQGGQIIHINTY